MDNNLQIREAFNQALRTLDRSIIESIANNIEAKNIAGPTIPEYFDQFESQYTEVLVPDFDCDIILTYTGDFVFKWEQAPEPSRENIHVSNNMNPEIDGVFS